MKISGFTLARNATKLYYPVKESIQSILPLVDEFVVALGNCDEGDATLQEIQSLRSDKIRIVPTVWDLKKYPDGTEYAHQTDIAKNVCIGDWLFYLQSDEVIHENSLPAIRERCQDLLNDTEVEGLLFDYKHFWGDYKHYLKSHAWYAKEIRIIRNRPDIHSWKDAQSFRSIPSFDFINYNQKANTYKLKVAKVEASVFHYGWVRPPEYMQKKYVSFMTDYKGKENVDSFLKYKQQEFNYGDLKKLPPFTGTHPAVMHDWIKKFNWQDKLDSFDKEGIRTAHKHEKWKYRFLSWVENRMLGGNQIFSFKNYQLLNR